MNNLDSVREPLIAIIRKSGELANKFFSDKSFTIQQKKSEYDIVTQADLEVDSFLQKELKKLYPESNFLTEETAPEDFFSFREAENLWVIDPIDGTANFSRQHPNFAISVALVNKSQPQLGVVYQPALNNLYFAQIDENQARLNSESIGVSKTEDFKKTVLACDWSWDMKKRKQMLKWLELISQEVRQIKTMGSCASDLSSLAAGQIDAHIIAGVKPWDVAAASLIVEKAGGTITKPDGSEWNFFDPDFVATNGKIHDQIIEILNK